MKNNTKNKKTQFSVDERGMVALTSVIIMSGFFMVLFLGMFFSAAEDLRRTDDLVDSRIALHLANSCVEEGLNRLKFDSDYEGDEEISVGEETCRIREVESRETIRIVSGVGEKRDSIKNIQAEVHLEEHEEVEGHFEMELINWREVDNFTEF